MNSNVIWVEFINMLPVILCGCVLPILMVWLVVRKKMNETNARAQIVTAAIEKNPDLDIEDLLKKISPKKKLLKEKLLMKLLCGCIASILGIGLIAFGFFLTTQEIHMFEDVQTSICFGVISLAVGAAFIINYGVGKKMLAKEIEVEEKNRTTQVNP